MSHPTSLTYKKNKRIRLAGTVIILLWSLKDTQKTKICSIYKKSTFDQTVDF